MSSKALVVTDSTGSQRTQSFQTLWIQFDIPTGKKHVYQIIKTLIGVTLLECFHQKLISDKQFLHSFACFYRAATMTNRYNLVTPTGTTSLDPKAKLSKHFALYFKAHVLSEYPTFLVSHCSGARKESKTVILKKKGTSHGCINYSYSWVMRQYNGKPVNELQTSSPLFILEQVEIDKISDLGNQLLKFKSDHQVVDFYDILSSLDLHAHISLSSTTSLANYDSWLSSPSHDTEKEVTSSKVLARLKKVTHYKGKTH